MVPTQLIELKRPVFTTATIFVVAVIGMSTAVAADPAVTKLHKIQDAFVQIAQSVRPTVVALTGYQVETSPSGEVVPITRNNGSGFFLSTDGLIATNYHVIESADVIEVTLFDGTHHRATVVGKDRRSDLAVLRVHANITQVQPIQSLPNLKPGQWVLSLGNPLGFARNDGNAAVSIGVVSALNKSLTGYFGVEGDDRNYDNMIQTTLDFPPGQSGGPIFNLDGQIVGIATATFAVDDESPGVSFAIPMSHRTRCVLDKLSLGETIRYGLPGVQAKTVDAQTAKTFGLPHGGGAMITVLSDLSAARLGTDENLRLRDVIIELAGERIRNADALARLCATLPVDQQVEVVFFRNGKQRNGLVRLLGTLTVPNTSP